MMTTLKEGRDGLAVFRDDAGYRRLAWLPIKFGRTVTLEFVRPSDGTRRRRTFHTGEVVDNLVVSDFDDFTSFVQFRDGFRALGVPRNVFIAAPNF